MVLGPLPSVCMERMFHLPLHQATYILQFYFVFLQQTKGSSSWCESGENWNFVISLRTTLIVEAFAKVLVLENESAPSRNFVFCVDRSFGHRGKIEVIVKSNWNSGKSEISINRPSFEYSPDDGDFHSKSVTNLSITHRKIIQNAWNLNHKPIGS